VSRAEAVRVEEAHASREKGGAATDARGLPAFLVLDEIAPPARQVGVNHCAALGEQPTDAARLLTGTLKYTSRKFRARHRLQSRRCQPGSVIGRVIELVSPRATQRVNRHS
jgi:hypothetical protein